MHTLPFFSVDEAKQNIRLLKHACDFYSLVQKKGRKIMPCPPGLQSLQEYCAKALGCTGWRDLVGSLSAHEPAPAYFDSADDLRERRNQLALALTAYLHHTDVNRVYAALLCSEFGCSPSVRKLATIRYMPCKTVEQWQALESLRRGYERASRYSRSIQESKSLRREYENRLKKLGLASTSTDMSDRSKQQQWAAAIWSKAA